MAMFLSPTYDWTAKSLISLWSVLILNNMPRTSYILDMGLVTMDGIEERELTLALGGDSDLTC